MATLTGTQIKNTYDSLLKLEDNDGVTSVSKLVTDGLGNATPLSISNSIVKSTTNIEAVGFKTPSGTSSDFLLADGGTTTVTPQVQSDWTATAGDALILNKPTIPSGNQILDWVNNVASTTIHIDNLPTSVVYDFWRVAHKNIIIGTVSSGEILNFANGNNTDVKVSTTTNPTSGANQIDVTVDVDSSQWNAAYTHSQSTHAPTDAEANVQSDWNATSGDALILNKPTLGGIGGSGTDNYVPLWDGTGSLNDSEIFQLGTDIGIGTQTPSQKLSVEGNISLATGGYLYGDTTTPRLRLTNGVGSILQYGSDTYTAVGSGTVRDFTGGVERSRMNVDGDLGIGTQIPRAKMHIKQSTTLSSVPALGDEATALQVGGDAFGTLFSTLSSGKGVIQQGRSNGTVASFDLLLQPSGGKVGIAEDSPTSRLHVNGLSNILDNATAISNGLTSGAFYHTNGALKVVY